MEKIKLVVEGKELEVPKGTTLGEVFKELGIKDAVGALLEGELVDLQTPLRRGGKVKPLFRGDEEALPIMRHSLAHVMAQALKELYGPAKVRLGVGPDTEEGFFYDVEVEGRTITEEELKKIEEKMREIVKRDYPIVRKELTREEAKELFKKLGERYKLELIDEIPEGEPVSVYEQGGFVDLCKGPHLPSTGKAGAFKLTAVSGAYWKGDASGPQLTRIYGMAYWDEEKLNERLKFYEEVKRRDHRRLGKELEFFTIENEVGPGLVLWLPRGALYRKVLEDYLREEHLKRGYQLAYTPHVGRAELWKRSGHLEHYKENMFPPMQLDEEEYYVKPMNCPFHITIYKTRPRSYRELPFKLFELGTVYRYELSGVLHGLLRVRGFTQDDAHIVCTPEQVNDVIRETLEFALQVLRDFGFEEFKLYLSTRPEDAIGSDEQWELSQKALEEAVKASGYEYEVDEGGGAFYGPKIDVKVKDAIGRLWQLSTIQFDFNLPERFDMTYVGPDNKLHRPYMIHRALLGSIERFTGILLEHHAGLLPFWLSPTQVAVLPVADRHHDYARRLAELLTAEGFRAEADLSGERLGAKIRKAELTKVPVVLVVGDREQESGTVSVRTKKEGSLGSMSLEELIKYLNELQRSRR
ncbi:MAG: threonine--tRNA ligase [Aquificae bacterium]|nr:threonine--tRNA ligase [Aquificota bacterium]